MRVTYHKEYSTYLKREMEYKVYGHSGKPVLVFPSSEGRFYQYEDTGMINAVSSFIKEGKIQVWTVDSVDSETFFSAHWDKLKRNELHNAYFDYINEEIIPSIIKTSKKNNNRKKIKLIVTGCSFGAYHSANFYFRYPKEIDTVIGLSGVYSTDFFFYDYKPREIFINSPIDYLESIKDKRVLNKYKKSQLIFCCGQGAYEEDMLYDTYRLKKVLDEKQIPSWVDIWGYDVDHDWPWWQKQIYYFLDISINDVL